MKYKASENLLGILQNEQERHSPNFICQNCDVDIMALRRVLNSETVTQRTLSKIAKAYNLDFKKCYTFIEDKSSEKKIKKPNDTFVEDEVLISELDNRIKTLSERLECSVERLFRSKMSGTCTLETFKRCIKSGKFTTTKFNSIQNTIRTIEISYDKKGL
jgi:hypothetical protein